MTKRRTSDRGSRQPGRSHGGESDRRDAKGDQAAHRYVPSPSAVRETIESVVVAFVLAFLFRTFEAEAFVIPTGSMAPTLMGRHKDLECPVCGYEYQASASEEVDQTDNSLTGSWVEKSTCPMCRYTYQPGEATPRKDRYPEFWDEYPSYKGDRILVGKFCYQFGDPERWDVVVFKFPGGAQYNYIKRLAGLPGETIRIEHGDVFVCADGGPFTIARKQRPEKLLAMLQPVYDNDYVLPEILKSGWPARWQAWPSADGGKQGAWTTSDDFRSFQTDGRAPGETWLRYQHVPPLYWRTSDDGEPTPVGIVRPQLISDFTAYNTSSAAGKPPDCDGPGLHWVGDLAVRCTLDVLSGSGSAVFELVEGGWRMQCRIDVATGTATLAIDDETASRAALTDDGQPYRPVAQTAVRGPGQHEILFANCDDQLRLWVDGTSVEFDTTTCYAPLDNRRPRDGQFASDLRPVSIGSQGATLKVSHLKVLRDIYYIAEKERRFDGPLTPLSDYENPFAAFGIGDFGDLTPEVIADVFTDPSRWGAFDAMRQVEFSLEADQFFMLGDNSAKSRDSRLWARDNIECYVRRDLLIGKALYIYWPHSWNRIPGTSIPFPLFPNFARMGFVR